MFFFSFAYSLYFVIYIFGFVALNMCANNMGASTTIENIKRYLNEYEYMMNTKLREKEMQ